MLGNEISYVNLGAKFSSLKDQIETLMMDKPSINKSPEPYNLRLSLLKYALLAGNIDQTILESFALELLGSMSSLIVLLKEEIVAQKN